MSYVCFFCFVYCVQSRIVHNCKSYTVQLVFAAFKDVGLYLDFLNVTVYIIIVVIITLQHCQFRYW